MKIGEEMRRLEQVGIIVNPTINDILIEEEHIRINPASYFENIFFPKYSSNLNSFLALIRECLYIIEWNSPIKNEDLIPGLV